MIENLLICHRGYVIMSFHHWISCSLAIRAPSSRNLHAGDRAPDGRYLYYFKNVGRNLEGVEMEGGTEIFGDGLDSFVPDHMKPLPETESSGGASSAPLSGYLHSDGCVLYIALPL